MGVERPLKRVVLNDNRLTGAVPASLEELSSLTWLQLNNNRLASVPEKLLRVLRERDVAVHLDAGVAAAATQ